MRKFVGYILVLITLIWGLSCGNFGSKSTDQNIKKKPPQKNVAKVTEEKFKNSPTDLKNLLPVLKHFKVLSQDTKEIRKKDFSVNMYEVKYSTTINSNDTVNTETIEIRFIDHDDDMLYPPLVAHKVFYKFGIKKDSDLVFQNKELLDNWKIVYNYDKIKKEGSISSLKENLFITMNISGIDIEDAEKIFKDDILQELDKN